MRRLLFLLAFLTFFAAPNAHAALHVSASPTRTSPAPLSGQQLSGNQYIFSDTGPVTFTLDGATFSREAYAPYDFNRTAGDGTANPFNVDTLAPGTHTVTAGTATGTFTVGSSPPPPPPTGYRPPYDPRAVFNQRIPANQPDHPRSAAFMAQLTAIVGGTTTHLKTSGEVPAINRAGPGDTAHPFQTGSVSGTFVMPWPPLLGSGSDHPTIVLNGTDQLRIWQARIDGNTLRGTLGGRFCDRNDGGLDPRGQLCLGQPYAGNGTGNRLTIRAMLNEPGDWPRAPHMGRLAIDGRFVTSASTPPARGSDQNSTASYAVPMGSILQMDPAVNCDALPNPVAVWVCHQAQDFGLSISDGSASNQVLLELEDDITGGWSRFLGPRCSAGNWSCRIRGSAFPWHRLRVKQPPISPTAWR